MTINRQHLSRLRTLFHRLVIRTANDASGAAAVEFAVIVPMLTLMLVSVTDIGFAVYRKMQVEDAAQAGAQYAIEHGFDANAITNAVTSATNSSAISASPTPIKFCGCSTGSSISAQSCGTPCPSGAMAGTYTTVYAQGTYYTLLDYRLVPVTYSFNAQSTVRLQ